VGFSAVPTVTDTTGTGTAANFTVALGSSVACAAIAGGRRDDSIAARVALLEADGLAAIRYTSGTGGVPIGSLFNRLVFSLEYQERNILFNSSINADSKIMYVRKPEDRVQQVAPWLTTDSDPYPAVVDGRLTWILALINI